MTHDRIVRDPKIMSGKPFIKGIRTPVETILRWLGKGETFDALLVRYPTLTREDIQAAQTFAADLIASERVVPAA